MLNEKEIFQWHSNENILQIPSPDRQSHYLGIGYKKKQVMDPLCVITCRTSIPIAPSFSVSWHLFISRDHLHLPLLWGLLHLQSGISFLTWKKTFFKLLVNLVPFFFFFALIISLLVQFNSGSVKILHRDFPWNYDVIISHNMTLAWKTLIMFVQPPLVRVSEHASPMYVIYL